MENKNVWTKVLIAIVVALVIGGFVYVLFPRVEVVPVEVEDVVIEEVIELPAEVEDHVIEGDLIAVE